jgi:hypothetical protein
MRYQCVIPDKYILNEFLLFCLLVLSLFLPKTSQKWNYVDKFQYLKQRFLRKSQGLLCVYKSNNKIRFKCYPKLLKFDWNKNVDIEFSAHDAFPESLSSGDAHKSKEKQRILLR